MKILLIGNKKTDFAIYLSQLLEKTGKSCIISDCTLSEEFALVTGADGLQEYNYGEALITRNVSPRIETEDVHIILADNEKTVSFGDCDRVVMVTDMLLRDATIQQSRFPSELGKYAPVKKSKGAEADAEESEQRTRLTIVVTDYVKVKYGISSILHRLNINLPPEDIVVIPRNEIDIQQSVCLDIGTRPKIKRLSKEMRDVIGNVYASLLDLSVKEKKKLQRMLGVKLQ